MLPVAACRVGVAPRVLGCRGGWGWGCGWGSGGRWAWRRRGLRRGVDCGRCEGLVSLSHLPETLWAHEDDQPQRQRLRRPGTGGRTKSRRAAGQGGAGWTRPEALWAQWGHQPQRRRLRRHGTGGGKQSRAVATPSGSGERWPSRRCALSLATLAVRRRRTRRSPCARRRWPERISNAVLRWGGRGCICANSKCGCTMAASWRARCGEEVRR